MGFIDRLNAYIEEKGSAVILGKHLDFYKDLLMQAEKEIALLRAQVTQLRAQVTQLQAEIATEKQRYAELQDKYDKLGKLIDEQKNGKKNRPFKVKITGHQPESTYGAE